MSVTEKVRIGTVDLTPSWEQQARMCIEIMMNSDNPGAVALAKEEILRIARIVDDQVNAKKERIVRNASE